MCENFRQDLLLPSVLARRGVPGSKAQFSRHFLKYITFRFALHLELCLEDWNLPDFYGTDFFPLVLSEGRVVVAETIIIITLHKVGWMILRP